MLSGLGRQVLSSQDANRAPRQVQRVGQPTSVRPTLAQQPQAIDVKISLAVTVGVRDMSAMHLHRDLLDQDPALTRTPPCTPASPSRRCAAGPGCRVFHFDWPGGDMHHVRDATRRSLTATSS